MLTTTEQVWEAFHTPLQQFIRRRVSDEATAEDVLQDVFLKIHQHMETLRDVKKLESWMLPDHPQCHHRFLPRSTADNHARSGRGAYLTRRTARR